MNQIEAGRDFGILERMIKSCPDLICAIGRNGNFIFANDACNSIIGYKNEELIGRPFFDFVHPRDYTRTQKFTEDISKGLRTNIFDNSLIQKCGQEVLVQWSAVWYEEEEILFCVGRAATERKNESGELGPADGQLLFKPLFEQNPDMALFQDKEGVIIDVNHALLNTYNLEKQDIVKRRLSEFLPPEAFATCEENVQKALKGGQERFEIELVLPGFGRRIYDIKKIPVTVGQEVVGVYSILKDITEITTSLVKIKEQANKLNTIFESITDAFFTLDREWNFTFINREFDRLLQTDRTALLGKNIWDIFPDEVNQMFYRQYHYAVQTGQAVHFESYFKRLDIWLEVKAFPSDEGLSVYFSDVTEKVKSKQELEKLSLVASKTINGVVITDANGLTEWVNAGFTKLTGYTLPEVAGNVPGAFLTGPETDKTTVKRIEADMRQAHPSLEEILLNKKSGEKLWILLEVTPILNDVGKLTRFIGILTDITHRKEAEEIQQKLRKDLDRQNQDLQQFTYIVSHNLRAPVANAFGLAELLTETDKNSEIYDLSLANLKTSIGHLKMVLSDLNLILSIRDNKDNIQNEQVDVAAVCRQVIESLQDALLACGGEVLLQIEEGCQMHGIKAYIYSIFHNLLSNSIKYRSAERDLRVIIKCNTTPDKGTIISISDNGSGIDTKKAGKKIFSLYKRFHSNIEGRGIGLFLVKTHVESMGGHIEIISQLNEGTKFLIYSK